MLNRAEDIWELTADEHDRQLGADYAAITLPWTFNRMMLNTSASGQNRRAQNIAKGIVGQEMLKRALESQGVEIELDRTSHRDDDLFDFRTTLAGKSVLLDVKTVNYYRDYDSYGRDGLTPALIAENRGYPGPDWRRFLPCLVPHTQIGQDKEAYCFAIASSDDFRTLNRPAADDIVTAFPYGKHLEFLSSKRLIAAREDAGEGFIVEIESVGLLQESATLSVIGEWEGKISRHDVQLGDSGSKALAGPFSAVCSFQVTGKDWWQLYDEIHISVVGSAYDHPVLNSSRRNINEVPDDPLVLQQPDFCQLMLPDHYRLFVLGWITKAEFVERCREYTGWVWPDDDVSRFRNQKWAQITDSDVRSLERADFGDCIVSEPEPLVAAGWMKTHGRGGGACCYYYPNIGYNGGVKETNLYVLPQDLRTMDDFVAEVGREA